MEVPAEPATQSAEPESQPAEPASVAAGPETTAKDFDYRLIDTPEAFEAMLASLAGVKLLSVDTETTDRRPMWAELVGVSLAWRPGVGYYMPVRGPMGCRVLDLEWVRRRLGPVLADESVAKVGHNIKYDVITLAQAGMPLKGIVFDTFLAGFVLDAAASGKMDNWSLALLNHRCIPITDLIGTGAKAITMDQVPTDAVAVYSAEDAEVTLRLMNAMQPRLAAEGLTDLLGQVELPLLSVLADMEQAGIRVDPVELEAPRG